jgi:tetratricopeptide (TPR) repeat protein
VGRERRRRAALARELAAAGVGRLGPALAARLDAAARAYERERYAEALRGLEEIERRAPEVPAVRELMGLTLYRMGRWHKASRVLRRYAALTGSHDQDPVIADCARALGRHEEVERVVEELRHAGVGREVFAEAEIVLAGSLADRGELGRAIALLEGAAGKAVARPTTSRLRQWYALAALYEQAGDLPRARELFRRVVAHDPDLGDAAERLAQLS